MDITIHPFESLVFTIAFYTKVKFLKILCLIPSGGQSNVNKIKKSITSNITAAHIYIYIYTKGRLDLERESELKPSIHLP